MAYIYYTLIFLGVSCLSFTQKGFAKTNTKRPVYHSYDEIYPYYVKYCTMSRIHPKVGHGRVGGSPGHAVVYIKGACLNNKEQASGLEVCRANANYKDPELGVGISTNKNFKNVNFVGVPGQKLFFGYGLLGKKRFTLKEKQRVITKFLQKKVLNGVEFHSHKSFKEGQNKHEFFAGRMFGTDYAIALARNIYCISIPTNRRITEFLVNEFNQVNQSYKGTKGTMYRGGYKKDSQYHWHGIFNNCAHTIVNIFAKLGIMGEKKINQGLFSQLGDIAIPANIFLALQKKINTRPIDPKLYYLKKKKQEVFEMFSWIPQQEGSLLQKIPFYRNNDLYQEDDIMLTIPDAFGNESKKLRQLMTISSLKLGKDNLFNYSQNLDYYKSKYQLALKESEEEMKTLGNKVFLNEEERDFYGFLGRFMGHLKKKLNNIILKQKAIELLQR